MKNRSGVGSVSVLGDRAGAAEVGGSFCVASCLPLKSARPCWRQAPNLGLRWLQRGGFFQESAEHSRSEAIGFSTADSSRFCFGLGPRTPQDSLPQLRNRLLPKGRTPGPGVGLLQPSVKSCSWKPPSMLPRWPHAPASRRHLSSSEGASLVCGFPLGPVSGLLYLSLAWVNRSRPEQR